MLDWNPTELPYRVLTIYDDDRPGMYGWGSRHTLHATSRRFPSIRRGPLRCPDSTPSVSEKAEPKLTTEDAHMTAIALPDLKLVLDLHRKWLYGEEGGRHANLGGANLGGANLRGANLGGANLRGANLRGVDLYGVKNFVFSIVPEEGAFIGWKKLANGVIAKLEIPADAKRTSTPRGRKNRAEFVRVLELFGAEEGVSQRDRKTVYRAGEIVRPDSYNDDIREECTNGIHFFITRAEAEAY